MKNVEALGKCSQCGMCQVVCNNLEIKHLDSSKISKNSELKHRDFTIKAINPQKCDKCKAKNCLKVCPSNHRTELPGVDAELDAGKVEDVFVGHALDQNIQKKAASGGFITSFIKYLLDENIVDKAIMAGNNPENPKYGSFSVYDKSSDITKAASSIYTMIPLERSMAEYIRKNSTDRIAFIGRPCQINSLEKAKEIMPKLEKSITLTVCVFCAWSVSQKAVDYLSRMSGVKKSETIKDLNYRSGVWPGNFTIATNNGQKNYPYHRSDHFKGVYYYPTLTAFIPKECTRCHDVLANNADIAVGDAWYLNLTPKNHGYSLVVSRTKKASDLIKSQKYLNSRFVIDKECTVDDLLTSQGNTLKLKQSGVLTSPKIYPKEVNERLHYFSIGNKMVSFLIKLKLERTFLKPLFGTYLKMVWPKKAHGTEGTKKSA